MGRLYERQCETKPVQPSNNGCAGFLHSLFLSFTTRHFADSHFFDHCQKSPGEFCDYLPHFLYIFVDRLARKVDDFLVDRKNSPNHLPLIIKGARQIGKTEAIEHFSRTHYDHVVEINFGPAVLCCSSMSSRPAPTVPPA